MTVQTHLDSISFGGLLSLAHPSLWARSVNKLQVEVYCTMTLPDSKTGKLTQITMGPRYMRKDLSKQEVIEDVEYWFKKFLVHEFYESFNVDGKLYKNLHGE